MIGTLLRTGFRPGPFAVIVNYVRKHGDYRVARAAGSRP